MAYYLFEWSLVDGVVSCVLIATVARTASVSVLMFPLLQLIVTPMRSRAGGDLQSICARSCWYRDCIVRWRGACDRLSFGNEDWCIWCKSMLSGRGFGCNRGCGRGRGRGHGRGRGRLWIHFPNLLLYCRSYVVYESLCVYFGQHIIPSEHDQETTHNLLESRQARASFCALSALSSLARRTALRHSQQEPRAPPRICFC